MLSLEPAHRHVPGEAAPAAGTHGIDGPLASTVLAFRRCNLGPEHMTWPCTVHLE